MLAGPRGWSHQMCPGLRHRIGWLWEGWGGGTAMFWPIVSRACTNCWTGSIALVDSCAETGGDCCRVGGVCELHDGGGVQGWHFCLAFEIQCHWFTVFQGVGIKQDFGIQPFDLIMAWIPFGLLILRD